jgi:hypothetical protein
MYDNSTPNDGQVSSSIGALITAINNFPQEWALTPCIGKRNLWSNWNKTKLDRAQLIEAIRSQKNHEGQKTAWTGVSIVTGPLSNGVMAIDFDGPLAIQKYLKLSGEQLPPATIMWSSGKSGHFQLLLQVPPEKWEGLEPKKIELENGNKLELRWNQCSTLPPSIHPDTEKPYFWKKNGEITECPDFILDLMREASAIKLPQPKPENPTYIDGSDKSLVDLLEQEILPRLDAEEFYGNYLKLKSAGKNLKALCPFHQEKTASFSISPQEKTFHCFGCGVGGGPVQFIYQLRGGSGSPTGKDFAEVVRELAGKVGVQMPDRKFNPESRIQNPKPDNILQHPTTNNVVRPREFQPPDFSKLNEEIDELLDSDLKRSKVQSRISELALKFRVSSADVWRIYHEREQELEQEVNREDTAAEVARLLEIKQSKIELSEILPAKLAEPIERLAKLLNLKPECYLAALLTQVSALFKVGTEIRLRRDSDYICTPNYFCGIVAESSQKKSPIKRAMIDRPMKPLQDKAREEYKEACQQYEEEHSAWKATKGEDKGPAPKEPRQRIYYFSKPTGEGILYQVAAYPDQALMYRCDELAGMLKSANQYRGGKGSDDEDLLEFWNGTGSTVLRAKGVPVDIDGLLLSVFGTIQPEVLAGFLKDCSDSNGKFARFDFVIQPLAASDLPDEDTELPDTTTHILTSLYKKVDALPKLEMEFDRDAKKLFATFYRAIEKQRFDEPRQGTRAMLGKMPEKIGKMAAIIHTINCVVNGVEVGLLIPESAVEAAIKFVKFSSDQIVSLYTEFSDRTALAPNLMRILQVAEKQGGKITVREAQDILRVKQQRPTAQTVREWFSELQEMKHGEVTTVKKSTFLTLAAVTRATVSQNLEPERVKVSHNSPKPCAADAAVNETTAAHCGTTAATKVPQLEPLPDKALDTIAASAAHISPPSEKSESLLLSYLTEPAEFAEQIRKAIANFDRPLALEIEEALKGQAKAKLRNEVKDCLTPSETKNFKLLAKTGFLRGMRVKYVGSCEQYQGVELKVHSMDAYFEICCLKPDGSFTTWLKPEEMEKL